MPLIALLVYVLVFAVVAYGLYWVCTSFAMPRPVLWIVGAILLIILIVFLAHQTGLDLGGVTVGHPIAR